ncbi:glutaminase domain-containing protein [Kitasatospora sp. NPDC004272]
MAAAVVQRLPAAEAVRFARAHYPVLRRKVDRQLWTAARLADRTATRDLLVNGVYEFATGAAQRVPFTDWYVVATAAQRGFAARPVVGGAFALLLPPAASSTAWCRIQNRNSGKVLAVSGMSTADGARVTQ